MLTIIILMERCPSNFDKQLSIFKDHYSNIGMCVDTNKTKVMIIKSKKEIHFEYDNNNLEEVSS